MLPGHLIAEFWATVREELINRFRLGSNAEGAIASYRAALDRHGVGELIYHRDPESVAETIAAGWEMGFPPPKIEEATKAS